MTDFSPCTINHLQPCWPDVDSSNLCQYYWIRFGAILYCNVCICVLTYTYAHIRLCTNVRVQAYACVYTIHRLVHTEWQTVIPRAGHALPAGQSELNTESITRLCALNPHVNLCSPAWLARQAILYADTNGSVVMDRHYATSYCLSLSGTGSPLRSHRFCWYGWDWHSDENTVHATWLMSINNVWCGRTMKKRQLGKWS